MLSIDFLEKCDAVRASMIEQSCLDTAWSERQILDMPEGSFYLVARYGGEMCGIASAYVVFDECQIMNIAVLPSFRRLGIGKSLLERILTISREKNCETCVLEVAKGNLGAIALYEACGFERVGARKDMFVMSVTLSEAVENGAVEGYRQPNA